MLDPIKQDESKASYCYKIKKTDGHVDLDLKTASEIYNLFRAYDIFPRVTILNQIHKLGSNFKLIDCQNIDELKEDLLFNQDYLVVDGKNNFYLKCKDNSYLLIRAIMSDKGKKIDLKGYQI